MGKILLSLALAAAFAIPSFAQDIVILKDGTSVDAKVIEVDDNSVRYKKFNNPDGPTYTAKKETISEIRYKNGSKEIFNQAKATSPDKNPNSVWWTKARETKLGFWMDPLGFAQWGPMLGVSIRVGSNFDVKAHVRYYNVDFPLNKETFDDYKYEYYDGYPHFLSGYHSGFFVQGFGIGLEFSKLFVTTHGNWHTGFLFEIATIEFNNSLGFSYEDRNGYSDLAVSYNYNNHAILDLSVSQYIFALTGGYTLRFNNRFFIDLSLQSGVILQILEDTEPYFYGDASLKLGIEL